jgi:hypothetical protein
VLRQAVLTWDLLILGWGRPGGPSVFDLAVWELYLNVFWNIMMTQVGLFYSSFFVLTSGLVRQNDALAFLDERSKETPRIPQAQVKAMLGLD